jgi:hypothetical protein
MVVEGPTMDGVKPAALRRSAAARAARAMYSPVQMRVLSGSRIISQLSGTRPKLSRRCSYTVSTNSAYSAGLS